MSSEVWVYVGAVLQALAVYFGLGLLEPSGGTPADRLVFGLSAAGSAFAWVSAYLTQREGIVR